MLLDNAALDVALESLSKDDFFSEAHRTIFEKMLELSEQHHVIDLVTLCEELTKAGLREKAGGGAYLAALTEGVPLGASAAVSEYSRIVKEKSIVRRLISASNNTIARCLEGADEPETLLDLAQAQILDISEQKCRSGDTQTFRAAAVNLLHQLEKRDRKPILSGLAKLDSKLGGFLPSELAIITARTGRGKTLLAQQIRRYACRHGQHSLFASCEMSHEQLAAREIGPAAKVDGLHLRNPEWLSNEEYDRLFEQVRYQCDTCAILHGVLSTGRIAAAARRMEHLSLVVIDYDELVSAPGKDRMEKLANVADAAWALAVSLKVPVLLLSQVRKSEEGSQQKSTVLDELYGPAAKSKHATSVVYIENEEQEETQPSEETRPGSGIYKARVGVAKNRFGDRGWVDLGFNKRRLEFVELA